MKSDTAQRVSLELFVCSMLRCRQAARSVPGCDVTAAGVRPRRI